MIPQFAFFHVVRTVNKVKEAGSPYELLHFLLPPSKRVLFVASFRISILFPAGLYYLLIGIQDRFETK